MDAETGGTTGLRFHASPGTRLGISAAVGIAVFAILVLLFPGPGRWHCCWGGTSSAVSEDLSHAEAELVLMGAAVMNLVAVGLALVEATSQTELIAGLINGATVLVRVVVVGRGAHGVRSPLRAPSFRAGRHQLRGWAARLRGFRLPRPSRSA